MSHGTLLAPHNSQYTRRAKRATGLCHSAQMVASLTAVCELVCLVIVLLAPRAEGVDHNTGDDCNQHKNHKQIVYKRRPSRTQGQVAAKWSTRCTLDVASGESLRSARREGYAQLKSKMNGTALDSTLDHDSS